MKIGNTKTPRAKMSLAKRLALAFAGVSSVAIIGSASLVAAHPLGGQALTIPNKDACKTQWRHFGFKNHGGCDDYWNKHAHHGGNGGGHGYGSSNTVNVTVVVNGNNNVVSVVINYFLG